jgi:hypothetical protein
MKRLLAAIALCAASFPLHARQTAPADVTKPLPPLRDLILDLEKNEKNIEAKQKDYTYHLHLEQQEFDGKGNPKKTTTTDSESLTIDGVRVDRIVARNGKPLTPDEAQKESDKIDKEVAKAKARREKREDKGEATDSRGDQLLTASRILELGAFSNPRRVLLDGRPTILADYAGDPAAKTHNSFEVAFRDLVGTVWIDEQDRVLVHVKGHFLKDFKIGGGLVADIKKDSSFEGQFKRINDEVWLPSTFNGQGKVRILLVAGFSGSVHMVASDYRKYRATSTIIGTNGVIGTDGQPATLPLTTAPATPPHR